MLALPLRGQILEHLDPAIHGIGHKKPVLVVDKYPQGRIKLSRLHPGGSEEKKYLEFIIENLKIIKSDIDDEYIAFSIKRNSLRPREASPSVADGAELFQKISVLVEDLHSEVIGVHDVDLPASLLDRDVAGVQELPLAESGFPEGKQEFPGQGIYMEEYGRVW